MLFEKRIKDGMSIQLQEEESLFLVKERKIEQFWPKIAM
jgi:hypothetical protein